MRTTLLSAAALILTAQLSSAELLSTTNPSIRDNLCVGPDCLATQTFPGVRNRVQIRAENGAIRFEDTSTSVGFPTTDWQINANQTGIGGDEAIFIEDLDTGTRPLWIQAGAPSNSLFLGSNGNAGFGTALPLAELHLVGNLPSIRLETLATQSQVWEISGSNFNMGVIDVTNGSTSFRLDRGAPTGSLTIRADGDIGLGTSFPEGKLHTEGPGVQLAYFESSDGGPVQVRFRTDSENRRFLAVNNANEVQSQLIFLDDRINFTGETDSGANLWLSVGPNGIVSQGPTCSSPCDLTFDPEVFTVPAIDARAKQMWQDMHLPAIGPTSPDEPMNLTEKMGGVIHELEVAHIYIEQLHAQLKLQDEFNTQLLSRLEALEALEARE